MGINSKAIERIDKQIRMLKEDYTFNDIDDSFEEETEEFENTEVTEIEDTMKLNHIDDIEDDYDTTADYDTTQENVVVDQTIKNIPVNSNNIDDKVIENTDNSEEGVNIFLVYYIGIIIIAIFAIIVMYFLFT